MKDFNNNTYSIETITNNILTKMSLLNDDDYIFYDLRFNSCIYPEKNNSHKVLLYFY